jgi:predicted transposase YdaD
LGRYDVPKRNAALRQLIVLSGLRGLEKTVEEEIRKMPILNDIMDHKVLGREYKRGRAEGIQEGRQNAIQEGELRILRRLLEKRFGPIPAWVEERLGGWSAEDLEALSIRLLEAESLEELLG